MKLGKILGMVFIIAVLIVSQKNVSAQTRFLVGMEGVDSFDNYSFGVSAGLEIPFLKRYEIDLKDTFSPIEEHVSLGTGRANSGFAGGIIWLSSSWGLNGGVQDSSYDVTVTSKDADYASGGLIYRGIVNGLPARFSFNYIRQFNNGIAPNGDESSHLQGFDFGFTSRFGCFQKFACIRMSEDFVFGRVLTQGNPMCDGTFGVTGGPNGGPCPRTAAFGGGVTASISFEFPRRANAEDTVF